MRRWTGVFTIIMLSLIGLGVVSAQDATTVHIVPTTGSTTLQYGAFLYELDAADGPVVAFVTERIETTAGVEVRGVLFIRDQTGYRAAGEFVDAAPAVLTAAQVNDVLVLGSQIGGKK